MLRLPNIAGRLGLVVALGGAVAAAAGTIMEAAGWSVTADVPFRAPFVEAGGIAILVGLLAAALARRPDDDEYLETLRLAAFRISLVATAALVGLNEVVYFVGNRLVLDARTVVIVQLTLYLLVFGLSLRAGREAAE